MQFLLYSISILILFCSCHEPKISDKEESLKAKREPIKSVKQTKLSVMTKAVRFNDKNAGDRLLAYGKENPENLALIHTDLGIIKVRLYRDTPLHRANFVMMAKKGCYDNIVFSRAVREFIAQAGSTYEEDVVEKRNEIGKFTIPPEISHRHFHKRGALAAARRYTNNPDKRSDPHSFYFVEGSIYNDITLDKYESENNYTYTDEQRMYYSKNLGAAHIDGEHSIFGEVLEGQDIIKKITEVKTNGRQWPIKDIYILKIEILN